MSTLPPRGKISADVHGNNICVQLYLCITNQVKQERKNSIFFVNQLRRGFFVSKSHLSTLLHLNLSHLVWLVNNARSKHGIQTTEKFWLLHGVCGSCLIGLAEINASVFACYLYAFQCKCESTTCFCWSGYILRNKTVAHTVHWCFFPASTMRMTREQNLNSLQRAGRGVV